jgi:hypothetical protein
MATGNESEVKDKMTYPWREDGEELKMTDEEAVAYMDENVPGWRDLSQEELDKKVMETVDQFIDAINLLRGK